MGVEKLDIKKVKARYMINIDTSSEKNVIVGCNGGKTLRCFCTTKRDSRSRLKSKNYEISMTNALGGHSGADISKHRLNTITQVFGILASLIAMYDVRLVEIPTVGVFNAIPANFRCIINVLDKDIKDVKRIINEDFTITKQHYASHKNLTCEFALAKTTLNPLSANDNKKIIQALTIFPNGTLNYRSDLGISDVSSNVGFIELIKNDFSTEIMVRSMFTNKIKYLSQRIIDIANIFGLKYKILSENNP
jgi:dipeptidase D